MSLKFNPTTGQLDLVDSGDMLFTFFKNYLTVDLAFLGPRKVTLVAVPLTDSEIVFYNGLSIKEDCYTLLNNELTFDSLLDIRVGDEIDIRYVG